MTKLLHVERGSAHPTHKKEFELMDGLGEVSRVHFTDRGGLRQLVHQSVETLDERRDALSSSEHLVHGHMLFFVVCHGAVVAETVRDFKASGLFDGHHLAGRLHFHAWSEIEKKFETNTKYFNTFYRRQTLQKYVIVENSKSFKVLVHQVYR